MVYTHTPAHTLTHLHTQLVSQTPPLLSGRTSGFDGVLPSGPDITQFKQGVKTVAGKMAVLANGVMNTIQVRLRPLNACATVAPPSRSSVCRQDRYGSY